jgi:hypothetical protein
MRRERAAIFRDGFMLWHGGWDLIFNAEIAGLRCADFDAGSALLRRVDFRSADLLEKDLWCECTYSVGLDDGRIRF